jgi:hypothetical protein
MALYELEEFQGPRFLGFVRSVPTPPAFAGQQWLPDLTINDLEFEYILGSGSRPVMAHIMGWDSEAPIHGRPGLGERVSGELPPIKRKAKFSEKEIIRFLTPRAGTTDVQDAINSVYAVTADLLDAVQARVEWLRMQALSERTVVYNEGGVQFVFDYGLDATFYYDLLAGVDGASVALPSGVGANWKDFANANPVLALQSLCNRVQNKTGRRPAGITMSNEAFGYILQNAAVRAMIRGSSAPSALLTTQELQTLFSLYSIPPITTYDVVLQSEQPDGTFVVVRPMAANKVFLTPGEQVGSTLWGPTAESRVLYGTALAGRAPGIFAKTYGMEEPPSEWVKAVGVSFPSMPKANLIAQMKVW